MVLSVGPLGTTKDTYRIFFKVTIFQQRQCLHFAVSRWVVVRRRHSEWEVPEALPGINELRKMYHSVNMFCVLISMDGESEDLKPVEKALGSEEVTIRSKYVFFQAVE